MGVNAARVRFAVYVLASLCAAIAGVILIGQTADFSGPVAAGIKETAAGAKLYLDHVNANGQVIATSALPLTFAGGVNLSSTANINFSSSGAIRINDPISGMTGGTISVGTMEIRTGLFNQSGGNNTASTLSVGIEIGSVGTYSLSAGTLSTSTQFLIGLPVMSKARTCGSRNAASPSSGPRRAIRPSFQTPTRALPLRKKQMQPNIFFSSMFFLRTRASRMRAARDSSKGMASPSSSPSGFQRRLYFSSVVLLPLLENARYSNKS